MIKNTLYRCAMGMAAAVVLGWVAEVSAAIPTFSNNSGLAYSQNFNFNASPAAGLAMTGSNIGWTDNSQSPPNGLDGWFLKAQGGEWATAGSNGYNASTSASSSDDFFSYGTSTSATDRALGSYPRTGSGPGTSGRDMYTGLALQYTGTPDLKQLQVIYRGEWWLDGNVNGRTLSFSYRISSTAPTATDASDWNATQTWTSVTALNFVVTDAQADGSDTANNLERADQFNVVINTSFTVAKDQYILLRWTNPDLLGSDHGLAIDDVFIAVPETGTWAAGAFLSLAAVLGHRRSRRSLA